MHGKAGGIADRLNPLQDIRGGCLVVVRGGNDAAIALANGSRGFGDHLQDRVHLLAMFDATTGSVFAAIQSPLGVGAGGLQGIDSRADFLRG